MLFLSKFGYLNPIVGEVRGDAWPLLIARWKAHGRLSVRLNRTFFAICYCSGATMRNVYNSAVFTRVDLFALKFYLDRVVPINHSWHQKARDTGLPEGEDRIPLRSLVLTQYVWRTDGRTDRRTDGYAVAYTALVTLIALWRAVKTELGASDTYREIKRCGRTKAV